MNSVMIDVVLGMVFIFLMLSLVVAAIREAIEARLKARAKFLAYGIRQIFEDPKIAAEFFDHPAVQALYGGTLTDRDKTHFTNDPRTNALTWLGSLAQGFFTKVSLPSYLPSRTFALTVIEMTNAGRILLSPPPAPAQQPSPATAPVPAVAARVPVKPDPNMVTLNTLRAFVAANQGNRFSTALAAVLADAGNDLDKAVASLEAWYDASMDRISGWYKRETQRIMFMVGLVLAIALNVDTLLLIKHLAGDENARKSIANMAVAASTDKTLLDQIQQRRAEAEQDIKDIQEARKQITNSSVTKPTPAAGTTPVQPSKAAGTLSEDEKKKQLADLTAKEDAKHEEIAAQINKADKLVSQEIHRLYDLNLPIGWTHRQWETFSLRTAPSWMNILGWLLTAFGLSFGAPFWFDLMNKIMVIRSTVKPHEKSPEEDSEDRQKRK